MILSHEEFQKKVRDYVKNISFWGFYDADVDISSTENMLRESQQRLDYIQQTLKDLHHWMRKSELRLVHSGDRGTYSEPKGINAPHKGSAVMEFEREIKTLFGPMKTSPAEMSWGAEEPWSADCARAMTRQRLKRLLDDALEEYVYQCEESNAPEAS